MLLVRMLSVNPLNVHLADIVLIFVTEFIHAPDQLISLIRQIGQLVIQSQLMLPVFYLIASQVLKFTL